MVESAYGGQKDPMPHGIMLLSKISSIKEKCAYHRVRTSNRENFKGNVTLDIPYQVSSQGKVGHPTLIQHL